LVDHALIRDLAETMFATDGRGRLVGGAPLLHIVRTPDALIVRCRADLPDAIADAIAERAARPRGRPAHWSGEYADYARMLSAAGPLKAIRAGPLFSVPNLRSVGDDAVLIDEANADLLANGLDEWRPDVQAGLPMAAMVVGGRAVSICASVRASKLTHCAGVETVPAYRGRGLAAKAVAGWARAVQAGGAAPFYGTTFDNLASQGVARRLGLTLIGSEFSIECETG
jgi:hypothetical protein